MAAVVAAPAPATAGPLGACLRPVDGLPPPDTSLPALEHVKNRETYRERPEAELEETTWYSAEEPDTLVEPIATRLRSIHSKQATVITFSNKSPFRVRSVWVDFQGHEVVYSVLEPNSTRRYHTYQTHPWIVRELFTGTRMMLSGRPAVVGLAAEQTVEIAAPPQLKWSMDTFSCFPEAYRSSVQSLLLAHKHMEDYARHETSAADLPLQPLKKLSTSPPCSPTPATVPCSPRATLTSLGALPTSPKARRLTMSPVPASPRTPRAMALAGSPAGSGDAASASASTTTSISISSEASHFKATLTVSSPTRATLKQTVNIEVFNNPTASFGVAGPSSSSGGAYRDSVGVADQGMACVGAPRASTSSSSIPRAGRPDSAGRRSSKSKGLFNNLVHTFKHAFKPSLRYVRDGNSSHDTNSSPPATASPATTTHITLHLSQMISGATAAADRMDIDEPAAAASGPPCTPWPPVGTHLGHLPSHLLATIAEMAAPVTWQTMAQPPKGRPDIQPTLLAGPPKTAEEEAAELAAQQQEQQNGGADGDDDDDLPALI